MARARRAARRDRDRDRDRDRGGREQDRDPASGTGDAAPQSGRGRRPRAGRRSRAVPGPAADVEGGRAALHPDPDRAHAWTLTLDGAPQSHVDLDEPAYLDFAYQRRLGHLIDLCAPPGRPVHALHLGGGACTLARYTAATRPRSTQQVVERDGALVAFVRRELPLDPGARIRVRTADARAALAKLPARWADLVITDVFHSARTPAHLTSVEFLDEVRRVLAPGGWYTANLADGPPLAHLRAQIATAAEVFGTGGTGGTSGTGGPDGGAVPGPVAPGTDTLALVADPAVLRGRRFGNAVLAAAPHTHPLPLAELTRRTASDPHHGRVLHGRELLDFTGGAAPVRDTTAADSPAPPESAFR